MTRLQVGAQRASRVGLPWVFVLGLAACGGPDIDRELWFPEQLKNISQLSLSRLPALPASPGNAVADDARAVALGHRLYFDERLSANGAVSCASCHQPEKNFKDGKAQSQGVGVTPRKSMSVVGVAYSPWMFWDGRRDSLWAQALTPLENSLEHGANRVDLGRVLLADSVYREGYEALFGPLPDFSDHARFPAASPLGSVEQKRAWNGMSAEDRRVASAVFANIGKLLEAYQRRLQYGRSPFDEFADALLEGEQEQAETYLNTQQRNGLRLFIGRANCTHCHNGPLFTNNEFHNTGLEGPTALPSDRGRVEGVKMASADPFNCLGEFSDAAVADCAELRFAKTAGIELVGAFRTVSLRNIAEGAPFMHTGQFENLRSVISHYNVAQPTIISDELRPLYLSPEQIGDLVAFLESLSAPLDAPAELLRSPFNVVVSENLP